MTWELSDLLRAIATTIVIAIHASHRWWFGVNDTTTLDLTIFINTAINQIGRFTVPIFVILSGFALAKSEEKRSFNLIAFFQRRLWRILPPYILFSLLNLVGQVKFIQASWTERAYLIWQALITGMGDYHLYFLGIIFQCYLFYPLIRHIVFTPPNLYLLTCCTFTLFSWAWLSGTLGLFPNLQITLPDGNHLIYWLPYFLIGMWLAKDNHWIEKRVNRWRSQWWGYLFAIAAVVELSEFYYVAISKNTAEAIGHYTRPSVFVMSLMFLLWSISWRIGQSQDFPKSFPFIGQDVPSHIKSFIKTLSHASFATYLIHVWILRVLTPLEGWGGLVFLLLAIGLSWLGGLISWQVQKKLFKTKTQ
ncbi:MAG: hypothetical protein AUK48_13040 [Oscillatoriales cyanobacterium CG2_30_44_21]|nr:MAG: hypothetical protein AUK48_13040 [Oscillatoriales cyanobacterium CG2_30_44_21]